MYVVKNGIRDGWIDRILFRQEWVMITFFSYRYDCMQNVRQETLAGYIYASQKREEKRR